MVPSHLLVTNDFPPKIGGIQSYLWELWRRLPAETAHVYTTPYRDAVTFDAHQAFAIERSPEPVLAPYPWLASRVDRLATQCGAELVLLDPAVPLGAIGPRLQHPYGVVLHGAEVTIPGRIPGSSHLLRRVLDRATLVVAAGEYALTEAERCVGRPLRSVVIPPGVDHEEITPPSSTRRAQLRAEFGYRPDEIVVSVVTRLVPRKGIHTLIDAVASIHASRTDTGRPDVRLVIGGSGRELDRLRARAERSGAPIELLGRVGEAEKIDRYAAADLMAMPCHQRWGGLEQEGFGIVFLEGAAAGLPQIAGRSGGAAEAVVHGKTGLIVDRPDDPDAVANAINALVDDPERRRSMGAAARRRVVEAFDYQLLADRLGVAIAETVETNRQSSER